MESYVGPDRRRFNAGDYAGLLRRKTDRPNLPRIEKGAA